MRCMNNNPGPSEVILHRLLTARTVNLALAGATRDEVLQELIAHIPQLPRVRGLEGVQLRKCLQNKAGSRKVGTTKLKLPAATCL